MRTRTRTRIRGFTLIELVMVILIIGVLSAVAGRFIAQPVQGYMALNRRAGLVQTADAVLQRMTRELRLSLPNSIRVAGGVTALEFLRVRTGGRYRNGSPGNALSFTAAAGTFDVIGTLADAAGIVTNPVAVVADCIGGSVDCLVIYNTGQSGANAYAYDNLAALRTASSATISFARSSPFPLRSPAGRFYVVDTPVTYLCDPVAGTIRRYSGYAITTAQGSIDSDTELAAAGAVSAVAAHKVSGCTFSYQAGTASRGGLVTLQAGLSDGGESVTLLQQVHIENLP